MTDNWIDVADDLPERSTAEQLNQVLIYFRDYVTLGWRDSTGRWRMLGSPSDWTGEIKYWMPLPPAPRKK